MLNLIKYAGHYVDIKEAFGLPENAYLVEGYIKEALNGVTLPVNNLKLKRIISEYWLYSAPSISQKLTADEYVAHSITLYLVLGCMWKIEDKDAIISALSYHKNKAREYQELLDNTEV
jgi:hypothetical protein